MSEYTNPMRRLVLALTVGETRKLTMSSAEAADLKPEAERFAKARRIPIRVSVAPDGIEFTRLEAAERGNAYPELDALEVGQCHTFELPPGVHQRIRLAASKRSQDGTKAFTCTRVGDHLAVTRLPVGAAEAAACGAVAIPSRPTKYDLERLSDPAARLVFAVPSAEQDLLRLAAHRKAKKTGWRIRCRIQDDGTMAVYRVDATPAAQAAE